MAKARKPAKRPRLFRVLLSSDQLNAIEYPRLVAVTCSHCGHSDLHRPKAMFVVRDV